MVCCAVCGPAFFGWACFLGLRSGRFLSAPGLAALVVVCNRRFLLPVQKSIEIFGLVGPDPWQ